MKKVMAILLTLAMTLSLMAGCGAPAASSPAPAAPAPAASAAPATPAASPATPAKANEPLVFWAPFSGGDFDFMKSMVDEYNAGNPEYPVEFLSKDWGDSYYQSINSALMADSGPDVFVIHQSRLAEFIPTGKLKPISEINAGVDWATYNDAPLKSVTMDGVQYSIPLDTHAMVMYYNKDILARAGVTEEDLKKVNSLESWNAILDKISKIITDKEHVLDCVSSGANTIQQFWTWYLLNAQGGGEFLKDKTAMLNSEAGIKALDIMKDWTKKGYIKPGIEDGSSYDIFKSGAAAIQLTGVWSTGNYETAKELHFGVMPIPAINGSRKTWGDSHTLAVPTYSTPEHQVAAVKFVDFVAEHSITWAKAGHVPSKKSVLASAEYKAMPYRSDYADVINDVVYYPSNEKLGACTDIACVKISESCSGKTTAKEALDSAKQEIDKLLAK